MSHWIRRCGALAMLLVSLPVFLSLQSCDSDYFRARQVRAEFQSACPKPQWWGDVSISGVKIHSYDDLMDYWQNSNRSKNQWFRAAYQAVLDHPLDTDMVVLAINLMGNGDRSYPHMASMYEFSLERYFDYDRPLQNYSGESGDAIAGIVRKLMKSYNRTGREAESAELAQRLMAERGHEINPQLLQLLSLELADSLHRLGDDYEASLVLSRAIENYDGDWDEALQEKLDSISGR